MAKKDWMSRIPKLTLEEMKKMIFSLIEEILPVMEVAEKQAFIIKLLGKSGDDKLSSMASRWIAECMDEGVDPKDMCRRVVTSIDEHAELESLANPEIRALFVDWMEELESEVLSLYRERKHLETEDLRVHFKISRQGAEFLLEKLRKEGKIDWYQLIMLERGPYKSNLVRSQRMMPKVKCLFLIMSLIAIAGQGLAVTQPQEAQVLARVQEEARQGNYQLISPEIVRDRFVKEPGSLFLVDTRQEWEYQREHIKGSVNLPVTPSWWPQYSPWARAEMKKLLGPDKKREVVFYWDGLTWVRSDSAARLAVRLGYKNVYRYAEGLPQWKDMGLPTVKGHIYLAQPSGIGAPGSALFQSGLLLTLVGVFLGGLALNLTPCVYPLIPITVSYFGGRGSEKAGFLALHSLFYLLGLALTNSTLGVVAALTGGLLGSVLQHPAVLIAIATILVGLALSFFGLWELKLPAFVTQAASRSFSGYGGSLFMGLTLGVVAAPCIGPFLIGLLTYVASTGNPYLGFVLFFTLSLGLGIPLAILAFFSGRLERLPRSGEWMIWVRKLLGWVLVAMAAYFIKPLLHGHTAGIIVFALVILAAGVHLSFIDRTTGTFRGFGLLKKTVGIGAVALAVYMAVSFIMLGPGVAWQPYSEKKVEQAAKMGKPTIIDFYADWCAPCRELEEITFHDPKVVKAAESFSMLKVDLTRKGDPLHQVLLNRYEVRGVPTVVFLGPNGREVESLRVVSFEKPEVFIEKMRLLQ